MKRRTSKIKMNKIRSHGKAIKWEPLGDDRELHGPNRNSPIEFKKCKYTYSKFPPSDSVSEAKIKNVSQSSSSDMHSSCSIPVIKIYDSDDNLEELPIKIADNTPTKQSKMEQSKKEPFVFIRNRDIVKSHPVISLANASTLSENEIQGANNDLSFHKTLQNKTLPSVQSSVIPVSGICSNVQQTYVFSSLPNDMTSNQACGTAALSSFSKPLTSVPTSYSNVSGAILIPSLHNSLASITSSNLHGNKLTSHLPSTLASINGQCENVQGSYFIPTVSYPLTTMQESPNISGTIIMPSIVKIAPLTSASSSFKIQSGMTDSMPLTKSISTASETDSSKISDVEQCSTIDSSVCQSNLKYNEALRGSGNSDLILCQTNLILKNSEILSKKKRKIESSSSKTNIIMNKKTKKTEHLPKETQKISSFSQPNGKQKTDQKQSENLLSEMIKNNCPKIGSDNYNCSKNYNPVISVPKELCKNDAIISASSVTNSDKLKLVTESLLEKAKSKSKGSKTSIEMVASVAKHQEIQYPGTFNFMNADKLVSTKSYTKQNSKSIDSYCQKANHKHQKDSKLLHTNEEKACYKIVTIDEDTLTASESLEKSMLHTNEEKACNKIVTIDEDTLIASESLEKSYSSFEIDRQVQLTSNENLFKTSTSTPEPKKVDKSCEVTPRKNDVNDFFSDYLTDPDFNFFLSLMPFVKKMNLRDRLKFRVGTQEVLQKVFNENTL